MENIINPIETFKINVPDGTTNIILPLTIPIDTLNKVEVPNIVEVKQVENVIVPIQEVKINSYDPIYYKNHKEVHKKATKKYYNKKKEKINRQKTLYNINSGHTTELREDTKKKYDLKYDEVNKKWF